MSDPITAEILALAKGMPELELVELRIFVTMKAFMSGRLYPFQFVPLILALQAERRQAIARLN